METFWLHDPMLIFIDREVDENEDQLPDIWNDRVYVLPGTSFTVWLILPAVEPLRSTALPAVGGVLLIGAFGLVTFSCGIAALVFGYWRMKQLLR